MVFHRICLALLLVLLSCNFAWSVEANFSWLPNSESDIDSYRLYYGDNTRDYSHFITVEPTVVNGRVNGTITGLDDSQTYYFAVTAYTTYGYESNYSEEIVVLGSAGGGSEDPPDPTVNDTGFPPLETSEVAVTNNWIRVQFDSSFTEPVVIAKMITRNESDPCVVRVNNVSTSGFDIRLQEWDYLDDVHGNEVVSYFVMERGTYELADGTRIEADSFNTSETTSFAQHNFKQSYGPAPVVMTSIVTYNGVQTVTGRSKNIDSTGFEYLLQEQESINDGHANESVSYIVWDRSDGTVDGLTYSVGIHAGVGTNFEQASFRAVNRDAFQDVPFVVTDLLTANGLDVATVRCRNNRSTGIEVIVEEEMSYDSETGHADENVGYIALLRSTTLPLEAGEIVVNSNWIRVQFESSFAEPVVIAKMITHNESDPGVVRVNNVSTSGFDIRLQEWDYLDDVHGNEVVSYFVMERGTYELADGTRIEADSFNTSETTSFAQHNFKQSYGPAPVVMTSIVTYNGVQTVTGRSKNIDSTGFEYLLQEQESINDGHANESVSYIVWDRSDGTVDGLTYSVGIHAGVGTNFEQASFRAVNRDAFQDVPFVVTDLLTANGLDVATVRCRNNRSTGIEMIVEEERSYDSEIGHSDESVGYIAVIGN